VDLFSRKSTGWGGLEETENFNEEFDTVSFRLANIISPEANPASLPRLLNVDKNKRENRAVLTPGNDFPMFLCFFVFFSDKRRM
jgi:hypothetical protein